ncbi:MAG: NeuD/PglB/VioB family sugar acetyltransferase [Burkholderiales bacterium]
MNTENKTRPALLILGAGGHGRVVADAAVRQAAWRSVSATDRDPARCAGELLPGIALHAAPAVWAATQQVHIAIGDNTARRAAAAQVGMACLVSVIHPMASVSEHAHMGAGCFVAAQAVVAPNAALGIGVIVNHGAVVDHDVSVGDFSHIAPGAVLGGGVRIGSGVLVGAGASVLPGVAICADAVVGAGSVVCESLAQPGVYAGVPARKIK